MEAASFTGDLPDWFFRILMPEALWPYFVFKKVIAKDLMDALKERGTLISVPEDHAFVCLKVLPMGFCWAPFIAHTLMLEVRRSSSNPSALFGSRTACPFRSPLGSRRFTGAIWTISAPWPC